ncbi:DNA-binding PadR family transcriptional regulator [Sinobacterium caligoides]|uniref:DNA-binding PadR family transcriptional regulator n=1 Tax=Sinobacterium caligoides TaxID=933926 RepID=A0A3N2DZW3_9GAMM|nr:PadR family transcriptional regulator [Sinobacterium caligoides]ROS05317.1 DNA-binding PadR family transcriptional regulator [Sinobacterium caligoides]
MAAKTQLNTTDYAILGLLERRPWSAYELTQFMRGSNIKAIWPRAESHLYESPKKLARLGYSTVSKELVGRKTRAVYSLTTQGSTALQQWLAEPGKALNVEYEAMLKLIFGDIDKQAQQAKMLATIKQQVAESSRQIEEAFSQLSQFSDPEATPARLAQHLLVNSYIKEVWLAQQKWLTFADDFQQQWLNNQGTEEQRRELIRQHYQQALAPGSESLSCVSPSTDTPSGD